MDDPDLDGPRADRSPVQPPPDDSSADDPFAGVETAELADRLSTVAATVAVAECEFLDLLGEFDAREGWAESGGLRSTAHWLSWRVGYRLGVAREKVRVARALRRLPLLRATFAQGRLSYCKVRAVSRVATAETETELVQIALGATGAQLETVVRTWRRTLLGESGAASHATRRVRRRVEEDGSVVFTIRLTATEAPLLDSAMDLGCRILLDENGNLVETPEEQLLADELTDDPPAVRAEADAVVLLAESFLAAGPRGEAGDRHLVVVHADLEAVATAAADETARADRAAGQRPALPMASGTDDSAETHAAATDAGVSAETPASRGADSCGGPLRPGEPVHQAAVPRRGPTAWVDAANGTGGGQPISPSTVLRLLCGAPAQLLVRATGGHTLDLGRTRRHADRRQRRVLRLRDGGRCRFPGCTSKARLVPHHTHWWSRGGRTDLDLLVSLCPAHHLAVHELGYIVRALGRGRFAWRQPDGTEIPTVPEVGAGAGFEGSQRAPSGHRRSRTDPPSLQPTWGGEHLDLDHLLTGWAANLLNAAGHRLPDLRGDQLDVALREAAGVSPAA